MRSPSVKALAALVVAAAATAGTLLLLSRADPVGVAPVAVGADPTPESPAPAEAQPEVADGGGIRGRVLAAGGEALADAVVRARRLGSDGWPGPVEDAPSATTDGMGRFAFPDIEPGDVMLEVRDERGSGMLPRVRVRAEGGQEVLLRLLPQAEISGRVVDEYREPVAGAEVTTDLSEVMRLFYGRPGVPAPGVEERVSGRTDAAGRFRLARLPVGRYDLRVTAPDGASRLVAAVVAPVDGVDLVLCRGYEFPVEVAWQGATPPAAVTVRTVPPDAREEVVPGERGAAVVLTVLSPGHYVVVAEAEGFVPARGLAEIVAGRNPYPARLVLVPAAPATVRVRDKVDGKPLDEAHVVLLGPPLEPQGEPQTIRAKTDAAGRCEFRLSPGVWGATAWRDGHRSSRPDGIRYGTYRESLPPSAWRRVDAEAATWDIALDRDWVVAGTVRFRDGSPAPGIRVVAERTGPDGERRWSRWSRRYAFDGWSGPDGRFRIDGFEPDDTVTLSVWRAKEKIVESAPVGFAPGGRRVTIDLTLPVLEGRRGTLRGRVVTETGEPVPRALVFYEDRCMETGADGRFEAVDVFRGEGQGVVLAAGYPPAVFRPTVKERETTVAPDIVLLGEWPWIRGTVRDPEGKPVPAADVQLVIRDEERLLGRARTDGEGNFELARPIEPVGGMWLSVRAAGFLPDGDRPSEGGASVFRLRRGASLSGRVSPAVSVDGGWIELSEEHGWRTRGYSLRAAGPGEYRIAGVDPADVARARIFIPGFAIAELLEISLAEGKETVLPKVTLTPEARIAGTVVDLDGAPAYIDRISIPELDLSATVEGDGTFVFENLPVGFWTLTPGWGRTGQTVRAVAGRTETVRFVVGR